jgi:photosystem II stability/assembly factor-like uncharacterized protein
MNILNVIIKFGICIFIVLFVSCIKAPTNSIGNPPFIPQNGTWRVIDSPTKGTLFNVTFVNSKVGWATTYRAILKTNDGGDTWKIIKEINDSPSIMSVQFLNEQIGWIVLGDSILSKTNDGGNTWIQYSTVKFNGHIVYFEVFHFVNENVGWLEVSNIWDRGIFKTIDGGITWIHQLDLYSCETIQDIFFIDDLTGWATCSYHVQTNPNGDGPTIDRGYIYRTIDGGNHWLKSAIIINNWEIGSIHFFDHKNGVLGFLGIHFTDDGGDTWQYTGYESSNNIYFINKLYGWLISKNSIAVTTDGCKTWASMNEVFKDVSYELNSVYFYDLYNGWIVGNNGLILKYSPPVEK